MRSFVIAAAISAGFSGLANATPTRTEKEVAKRADSLPTVTASGNAFWAGTERFYIRGIDYQPGGQSEAADPLADTDICKRDIAEFKKLGVNTIRVYITDNSKDHSECMRLLADAGIYLILDANNSKYSINRRDPAISYNAVYLQSVFATIDEFAKYDNTLGFFSGNEVINDDSESDTTKAAPYVKATTRDMRAYIKARGYRAIPVGYSAADVSSNRMQTAHYFNCGSDEERSDFFAFNDYSWCSSDFITAGWDVKVKNFTGYGIPIFLSEWGCNTNTRNFGELEALMSDNMTSVYSGGLMYEYSLEESNYGIVHINGDKVTEEDEFAAFQSALSKYPAPTGDGGFVSTTNSVPCPTADDNWSVDSTDLPPIPEGAKQYMENGAGDGPGLAGAGSQTAGSGSSSSGSGSGSSSSNDDDSAAGRLDPGRLILTSLVSGVVALAAFMI